MRFIEPSTFYRDEAPPAFRRVPQRPRFPWTLVVLIGLAGVLVGRFVLPSFVAQRGESAAPRPVTARGDLSPQEKSTIALFEQTSPCVVYINTTAQRQDFFLNVHEIPVGTGSGFMWDTRGHIVTNFHVIQNAQRAKVTLHDGTSYFASLVGIEKDKDVAVLKIDAPRSSLRAINIGSSSDLRVGQNVLAIGDPFGLDYTLTTGIVSAINREMRSISGRMIQGVIQTDAAINPGNSGGPLLDSAGRLIGMNTAIYSPSGSSAGIGFAVPVDAINRVVPQLIAYGRVIHPTLGVTNHPVLDNLAARRGIKGFVIFTVEAGSPADKARLRGIRDVGEEQYAIGDIILKVDNKPIKSFDDLQNALEDYKVGDTVDLTIERNSKQRHVKVTLEASE